MLESGMCFRVYVNVQIVYSLCYSWHIFGCIFIFLSKSYIDKTKERCWVCMSIPHRLGMLRQDWLKTFWAPKLLRCVWVTKPKGNTVMDLMSKADNN